MLMYMTLLSQEKERQVITQIYLEHRGAMLRAAQTVLCDQAMAEEAVHDAMLELIELMRTKGRLDMENIRGFVCLIARHRALDIWRKERRHVGVNPEELSLAGQEMPDCENYALAAALAALPPKYRQILYLYARCDLNVDEIASVLGIGRANAKKRLQRAINTLKEKWREQNDDSK